MIKIPYIENYPEKFFIPKEEYLTLTPLGEYKALKGAVDFFKELILKLDEEQKYTTLVTKEKINQEIYKERSAEYTDQLRYLEELYEEYRKAHLDEYNEIIMINNTDNTVTSKGIIVDYNFTLDDAWFGYQFCNKELKKYGKGEEGYELLPKAVQYRSKDEFKEQHAQYKAELRKKLLIPDEDTFVEKEVVTSKQIKRAKKADVEAATEEEYNIYLKFFVEQNLDIKL